MNRIEVRHLAALVALVEEGTFTDAAIRLRVTQSAVSRTIAALEDAVGVELVRRTTRSVALTPAGRRCYRASVEALTAIADVHGAATGAGRPLRLGYAWSALGRYTTQVLRRWRVEHPDVALEVHRIDDRVGGVGSGAADVAVVRGAVTEADVATRLLFREPRMAALPAGHRLARRAGIALADLRDETVLTSAFGTTTLDLWPAGARPRRSLHVDNTDEWLTEIAGGMAVGVTVESTTTQHAHPGVAFVPLHDAADVPVFLVWPSRHPHPATGEFVELVAAVVDQSRR
jgi:DNA-binding transcriptional LysR family regulator